MKFTVDRKELLEALSISSKVVRDACLTSLRSVKITSSGNVIRFISSNLDVIYEITFKGVVESEISIVLPIDSFLNTVKGIEGKYITVDASEAENFVSIFGDGRRQFKVYILPFDDYPADVNIGFLESAFVLDAKQFFNVLNKTSFIKANDKLDGRVYLKNNLFFREGDVVTYVSTDGNRLAIVENTCQTWDAPVERFLIPKDVIPFMMPLLKNNNGTGIRVLTTKDWISFVCGNNKLTFKSHECEFPDYNSIFPTKFDAFSVSRRELKSCMESIKVSKYCPGVKFTFDNSMLTVEYLDTFKQEIGVTGDIKDEVVFNRNYILDVLKVLPNDIINIQLSDDHTSMLFTDVGYRYLVMHIREK